MKCISAIILVQTGRSRVRLPVELVGFLIDLILPATLWLLGQPNLFQKRVLGILRGGKGGRCLKLITLPLCVPGV